MLNKKKQKVCLQRVLAFLLMVVLVIQPQYIQANTKTTQTETEGQNVPENPNGEESEFEQGGESQPESESKPEDSTPESETNPEESEPESETPLEGESEPESVPEEEPESTPEPEAEPETEEESDEQGMEEESVGYTAPSDGSLAGQNLKFINLYWETDDLGEIEVVFDGGGNEPLVQQMGRLDRGIYETLIPEGDYSRVSFQTAGTEEVLDETAYNIYNVESPSTEDALATSTVDFQAAIKNTFYYDMGENASYWGADPTYESVQSYAVDSTWQPGDDYEVVANPGDMVYMVDMAKVEKPEDSSLHAAPRINIRFLEHPDNGTVVNSETFTMYEQRSGIYTAPFPQQVDQYNEIAFQLVGRTDLGEDGWLTRHYNFRGQADNSGSESGDTLRWGYFKYKPGYVDAFYLNLYEQEPGKDASFWGAHPSRADDSLDTQVLYVDVTDYTGNGIKADINDLWLHWEGMNENMIPGGVYDDQKGYQITDMLAQEDFIYFQFPYNSGATENTIITLTFTLNDNLNQLYTYKFTFVPRSGRNCLKIDNIWEFNGQMWTQFRVGEIEKRTIFFHNKITQYDSVYARLVGENGNYQKWQKMNLVNTPNEYEKENLYSLEVSSTYQYVQFLGEKAEKKYYSNKEEISTEFSYPCYYAYPNGDAADKAPDTDVENPGMTGFWRSVYSADTSGDESIDIPTAKFEREENTYYADTTFYDYYSTWEMSGKKVTENSEDRKKYYAQGELFNTAAEQYYETEVVEKQQRPAEVVEKFKAIYATDLHTAEQENKFWQGNVGKQGENANWWSGNGETEGPVFGLADKQLTDGRITTGATDNYAGVEMPFFNEDFLRGNNALDTAVGNVYKNVTFPFTKDTDENSRTYGYWVFNSARDNDALRLSYDVDNGYFLQRTGEPIKYSSDGRRTYNGFFPFSSQGDVEDKNNIYRGKLNLMFGTQFNIDFALTDNAEIYNEYTKKNEPIRFEFQGDDDAWIYIDGILALDLGGIHNAVRGEINFKEGTYTIWKSLKSGNTYDGEGTVLQSGSIPSELIEKLKKEEKHTLTMFYMERGLEESNLKLSFNFPRESTFAVEKEVDVTSNTEAGKENIFADLLQNMGGFNFEMENLVTSGKALPVEDSAGYLKPGKSKILYNESNQDVSFRFQDDAGTVTDGTGKYSKIIEQTSTVSGAEPAEETLLQIKPSKSINLTDMSYMRLAMKNTGANDASARNLYLSFVDTKGKRVGGYANTLGYEGETNSFMTDEDSVLRIAFQKMRGDSDFDWANVEYMLVGIRRTKPEDAASYMVSSIAFLESLNQTQTGGFSVTDDKISDYGSYATGTLMPVDRAWYIRKTKNGDTYDAGVSRQTDQGQFALADGQKAIFTDKFRTGSYIALKELNVDARIFDTTWTVLENSQPVDEKYLLNTRNDVESVVNPLTMIQDGVLDGKGTIVGDQRMEVLDSSWSKYDGFEHPDVKQTLVYRSYADPDTTSNVSTDLGVKVKNTLKYGSLTITKKLSDNMKGPDGSYKPGDYIFDIYYTDIAGMGLESQLSPVNGNERYVKQTVTVSVGAEGVGQVTVPNIPAGTTYHIVERPSNGTELVGIEIGEPAAENPHENVLIYDEDGNDKFVDYTTAYVLGTAYASNQEVIFVNKREPFYMDIEKIWKDGLTDEQRGIDKIYIKLQRRVYDKNQNPDDGWKDVTKDFFDTTIVDEENCIVLTGKDSWKMSSKKALPYQSDNGDLYEYRIQEIDRDGNLKNYEVSYNEVRQDDVEIGGETYLHVTYQAINTSAGITIQKLWEDNDNIGSIRPRKIRVKLLGSTNKDAPDDQWTCYKKLLEGDKHDCSKDDCYIELTKDSAWHASVNHLMLTDEENDPYYYKLSGEQIYSYADSKWQWVDVAKDHSGYEVTYGEPQLPNGDKTVAIEMTNRLDFGNITIVKQDAKDNNKKLSGAEFKLERLIPGEAGKEEKWEVDTVFKPRTAVTSATGIIEFKSLPYGTYRITEIKAPSGYVPLNKSVHVTISKEAFEQQAQEHEGDLEYYPEDKTITVTIKNEKGLIIPTTGGRGIFMFTIVGATLCFAAILLYHYKMQGKRRTRRRYKK